MKSIPPHGPDENLPESNEGAAYKVGPGKPPIEHRWPKGYCPNPKGRPRKKPVQMTIPGDLSTFQREILEFANTIVGEINGQPQTNFQAQLRTMKALTSKRPELGKELFREMLKAGEKQQEYDMLILRNAIEHKERWGPIFEEARRLGKAPPKVYPHPDDLLIRADGSVKVMGPLTADEARLVDKCLQMRDQIFDVVRQVINERGSIFSTERRLAYWISFRRKYYRFSNRIPKRLKIPFPPFELHPHDDDDE